MSTRAAGHQGAPPAAAADTGVRLSPSLAHPSCSLRQIEPNDLTVTSLPFHCGTQESFWKNPQFELSLTEQDNEDDEDDEDEDDDGEDDVDSNGGGGAPSTEEGKRAEKKEKRSKQCTVLVELLQKNRRKKGKVHFLHIAFHVYKVPLVPLHLSASAIVPRSRDCFFSLLFGQISPEVTTLRKTSMEITSSFKCRFAAASGG